MTTNVTDKNIFEDIETIETIGTICINQETKLPYILCGDKIVSLSSMWMFFNGYISFSIFIEMYAEEEPDNINHVIDLFNSWMKKDITDKELYDFCAKEYNL
jgi:hypothetical protein